MYCLARLEEKQKQEAYKIYVTDALQLLTESSAVLAGNGCRYLSKRYEDMLSGAPEDDRTAEEIIAETVKRAGLEVTP
jgi:hypothetical protein